MKNIARLFTIFSFFALCSCSNNLKSPDGKIAVEIVENGLQISYSGQPVQLVETAEPVVPGKNVEILVRNDGVAFRFLHKEIKTAYIIPDGLKRWFGRYSHTGYEALFPLSDKSVAGQWIYPALVEYSDGVFGFIAESDIEHGHSCSHLLSTDVAGRYEIETIDPDPQYEVTPWRFVLVGSLADIVGSTMMTDLAEPCRIEDTSWIKPGMSSWIYWAYNHGSKDYGIIRSYIDLAAEMGWPYCLVDWEWPQMEGGYTIDDVMAYANDKGVKINLWYNSGTSWVGPGAPQPEDRLRDAQSRENEFAWLESIGVAGVKIDFFADDGAEMVDYYLDILEDAARHHLLVDFHGSTTPRGWQRTWPNLMSMEAVWGAEWYNNVPFFTNVAASHNATLPFTRGLMGPMDYTPCAFSDSQHPHITTHAHELALPVLFQSSLQHMADKPESYLSQPQEVIDLLKGLPVVWDETRLLAGYPGESVVMARRSGDVWYVAGINGTQNTVTLTFPEQKGDITLFADGSIDREFAISHPDAISSVECRPNGGFCCIIK
ncbi:MAG: glycoside hydrolase family 97 protein [Bacteroidales bacterium]|nr:glycoside hydrolase family 97 protein [Bacteroidales bacterium]